MPEASTSIGALLAVLAVSAISLVGAVTLVVHSEGLRRALIVLVPFAAGALLGDAFLHLIPETAAAGGGLDLGASLAILGGILGFFVLEKVLHWHHAHFAHGEVVHPVAISNLVGDGLHNFVDGTIMAASFLVSPQLGVATSLAVVLHEIPQELGDFAILVHAGLAPKRALVLNLASGLTALLGAVATLAVGASISAEHLLVPFSAGAFVYIAGTDLIPELHKEPEPGKSLLQSLALAAGVAVMAALLVLE